MGDKYKIKKFKLNKAGVAELLKSEGAVSECRKYASQTLAKCNNVPGYIMDTRTYPERAGYAVVALKYPAITDNLKHNTLLKALK